MTRFRLAALSCVTIATLLIPVARGITGSRISRPRLKHVVVEWNEALLQGARESTLGPPMIARALAMAHTCMFDAWGAYDRKAVGTRLGDSLRLPPDERTAKTKSEAISFAAYRAAVDVFPTSKPTVFDRS